MSAAPPHPPAPVLPRQIPVPLRCAAPIAATSALLWEPPGAVAQQGAVVVLGHGAGSKKTNPILGTVASALAGAGHLTLAFNFVYAEMGRRAPDPMPRLQSVFRDAIDAARAVAGDRSLVLGGRSMGGRVGSMLAAAGYPCDGLMLLGYPLHPAGRPDKLRVAHWPSLRAPCLFVSGTRDAMFDLALFERHRSELAGEVTLHLLAGADHGFAVRKMDGRTNAEVLRDVCEVAVPWVDRLASS